MKILIIRQILPGVIEYLQTKYIQEKAKISKKKQKEYLQSNNFSPQKKSMTWDKGNKDNKKDNNAIEIDFLLIGTNSQFKIVSYEFSSKGLFLI